MLLDRKTSWKEIRESLSDLLLYREKLDELHHIQKNSPLPDGLKLGIGIPIIGLIGLRNWYRQVNEDYYGLLNGNAGLARALFTIDPNLARAIRDVFLKELQQPINDVMQNTAILHDLMELDDEELLSVPILAQTISQHLPILEKMVVNPADSLENLSRSLQGLRQLTEKAEHLAQQKAGFFFLSPQWCFAEQFDAEEIQSAKNTMALWAAMQLHPMTKEILQQNCTVTRYEQLRALAGKIAADHEAALQAEQIFMSSGNMDRAAWQGHYPYSLTATIERNAAALANSRWLHTWAQYTRERERVQSMGLGRIVDFLENDRLPPDRANDAIRLAIYHQLAGEIEAALPEINEFSIINGTVRHFREHDKKLMELQRRQIAANAAKKEIPAGVRGGPVRNFTEKAYCHSQSAESGIQGSHGRQTLLHDESAIGGAISGAGAFSIRYRDHGRGIANSVGKRHWRHHAQRARRFGGYRGRPETVAANQFFQGGRAG